MRRAGSAQILICCWLALSCRAVFASSARSDPIQLNGASKTGFTRLAPELTGLRFTNELRGDAWFTNAVAHNGSGVAIGDVDGDGRADLYFCNLQGANKLYRNLGGWHFEEMEIGVASCEGQYSTGAALADVDGDGDLDLLVNGIAAGTRLFLNDGKGHWTEAENSGLSRTNSATSLALADIDGDGDLDLYCTHYIDVMHLADPTTRFALARRGDKWEVTKVNGHSTKTGEFKDRFEALTDGSVRELPERHALYLNDGHGHFTAVQNLPGTFLNARGEPIPPYRDWGLAAMFRDINGDGAPDLYVCNDNASPDRFWMNTGKGTFREADSSVLRHTSRSSMGIDFADLDRDGHDDFIVVDMFARTHEKRMTQLVKDYPDPPRAELISELPRYNRNNLFFGRGDGTFFEAALMAGVAASDWSWCPVFLDVDLDGYEDLIISTGFSFDVMDRDTKDQLRQRRMRDDEARRSRRFFPEWKTPPAAFRNLGNGVFEPAEWGFDQPGIGNGMAAGDLDNDGDLDLVINNLNDTPGIYRNDSGAPRIAVRLEGNSPNTRGIGARLKLIAPRLTQSQEMISGGRYLSCDDALRVFAARNGPMQLEVIWRDGTRTVVTNVEPNRIYTVSQRGAVPAPRVKAPEPTPLFTDASALLNHSHHENQFDDWTRQPLLPHRFSRLGPGIGWSDLNGDGWEDLVIASGANQPIAIFRNDHGRFTGTSAKRIFPGDSGALAFLPADRARHEILAAVSNYEITPPRSSTMAIFSAESEPREIALGDAAPGPIALADIDGDGDLDLFAGGRCVPGKFPEPAPSTVFLNENGVFKKSDSWTASLGSIGLVSAATFCDLDADGRTDLAVAEDWGPIRVFHNDGSRFHEVSAGLSGTAGLWNSIVAGDFDGDGRLDLAAGNWGRNSEYELYRPGPIRIYYDPANPGFCVEAWQRGTRWLPIQNRLWLERARPEIAQRFPSHALYAKAAIPEITGATNFLEAREFESAVFLNRGDHFERIPLPREAQLSPVFGITVADFDGDSVEDLFLAQNFFGTMSEITRDDEGEGLLLRGKGDGTFTAVPARESGIRIFGEQRGCAAADFDHDGRTDLAVTENNAATKLYVNHGGKPGIRVQLHGPAGNPDGIGAQLRVLHRGGKAGPARAIQAGSGYWSQDASVPVLAVSGDAEFISVRWPGGKTQQIKIAPGATDIQINHAAK